MNLAEKLRDPYVPIIIGEIAQNHDGSLGMAHAYIDALADVGVDAVKFQTHIASEESTLDDEFRVKFSHQDNSRYDYWKRMEFTESQWLELKRHADAREIGFLSTPFSIAAVDLLSRVGVDAWKIGSGDTTGEVMLAEILSRKKPVIVSTGMSSWHEIDSIIRRLSDSQAEFCLMQCTSKYPTPLSSVGLNVLSEIRDRYGCRVGLSDHSGTASPALAAIARGFTLIEVHATFDRRMFGPDVAASLTIEEVERLVRFAAELREIDCHPVDKDAISAELIEQKRLFGRSLALVTDLTAGHVLSERDLTLKKPGGGLSWCLRHQLIGRALTRDVSARRLLKFEDIS